MIELHCKSLSIGSTPASWHGIAWAGRSMWSSGIVRNLHTTNTLYDWHTEVIRTQISTSTRLKIRKDTIFNASALLYRKYSLLSYANEQWILLTIITAVNNMLILVAVVYSLQRTIIGEENNSLQSGWSITSNLGRDAKYFSTIPRLIHTTLCNTRHTYNKRNKLASASSTIRPASPRGTGTCS